MNPEYDLHFLVAPGVSMKIRVSVEVKHFDPDDVLQVAAEHLQSRLGVLYTHHDLVVPDPLPTT